MNKYYITFGGQDYDTITQITVENAPKLGADKVLVYDDFWLINQDFYKQNKWLWEHPHKRGFGWYCWKPYIIWYTLQNYCQDGDVVMFVDADTYPINDFSKLYEICDKDGGIMLFTAEMQKQIAWCKADCSLVMGQIPALTNTESQAGVARFMLFQKGKWKSTQFLMEWLTYCVNPLANTFDNSILVKNEHPLFKEHRAEQAIMTNLAHKYNLELYREADQNGTWTSKHKDIYPQLFVQADPCVGTSKQSVTKEIGNGSKYRNIKEN